MRLASQHRRRPGVPGSLAKTRAETPRQKPDYGQRVNRIRTECADWLRADRNQASVAGFQRGSLPENQEQGVSSKFNQSWRLPRPPSMLAGQTHLPLLRLSERC
jgi:hypothetical protein